MNLGLLIKMIRYSDRDQPRVWEQFRRLRLSTLRPLSNDCLRWRFTLTRSSKFTPFAKLVIAMPLKENFTLSSVSLGSEDWDRSENEIDRASINERATSTPRNSVAFPRHSVEETPRRSRCRGKEGRSLSELMRLHAEKGTDPTFSAEEASRVADVLKQWVSRLLPCSID